MRKDDKKGALLVTFPRMPVLYPSCTTYYEHGFSKSENN